MIINDLFNKMTVNKRKRESMKTAQVFAAGMGAAAIVGLGAATVILFATKSGKKIREKTKKRAIDTVETISHTAMKKAEAVKSSVVNTADEICSVIEDLHGRAEGANKDIKDGGDEIKKNINETVKNISNEIKEK